MRSCISFRWWLNSTVYVWHGTGALTRYGIVSIELSLRWPTGLQTSTPSTGGLQFYLVTTDVPGLHMNDVLDVSGN